MERIKQSIKNNYTYISVFLIMTLVFIVSLIIKNCQPFGEVFPLPGNGFIQDYTQFCNAVRNVKSGKLFDFLDYGVGLTFDNYGMRSYSLSFLLQRPWLYLIYYIVPENLYIIVFLSYYYFNYVITGPIFIYYLTHRLNGKQYDKTDYRLIILGLLYGMSAFTICFFHYYFRFLVYIPLIFLGIEKIVYERRYKLYVFVLAYYMSTDAYYAFILCVLACFYFVILDHKSIKEFFQNGIRFGIASTCSACLSAAFLLPYFIRTRTSPYGDFDSETPSLFKWFGNLLYPLSEFKVGRVAMTTTPLEYRTNIYCGILAVICFSAFIFLNDISLSQKIRYGVFLGILYLGFDNQLINYVFHGFHYQWQVPNRFSAVFIFIVMVLFSDVLYAYKDIDKKKILASILISSLILVVSYFISSKNEVIAYNRIITYVPSLVVCLVYVILFILDGYVVKKKSLLPVILIMASIEVIFSAVISFTTMLSYSDGITEAKYINNMKALVARHSDLAEPYVISERPGETQDQNISYAAGTHSLSFYNSSSSSQHFDLLYRWGILFSKNITYYTTGSPLADMMLHVKYHFVDAEKYETISPYLPIDMEENVILYENPYYLPLGLLIENGVLDEWNQKSESYHNFNSSFERDNEFAEAFGVDSLYDLVDVKYSVEEDSEGNAYYTFDFEGESEGYYYIQIAQALEYIGYVSDDNRELYYYVPRTINIGTDDINIGRLSVENLDLLYNKLSQNTMVNQQYYSNKITGSVNVDSAKTLYFAMPNLSGFSVYVDGREVPVISYMDGIAIDISEGVHNIELMYSPPGVALGWQITVISAMLMLIIYLLKNRNLIEKKSTEE